MRDLVLMWRNTRMVVLCAISGALYAAVLVPFKVVPLIPGVTELRPANAIPVVCSFLFGPAAAWGTAIGNVIGDFFGGVGPGDIFGFLANLAYGYVPYKVWNALAGGRNPIARSPLSIGCYVTACLLASMQCADIVGWGENLLALRPFSVMGNVIVFNNLLASLALAPFLLYAIYPRVCRGRMLYQDMMPELRAMPRAVQLAGLALLAFGVFGAWVAGNLVSTGYWEPAFLPLRMVQAPYDGAVAVVVSPFILVSALGLGLM